jgi:hypothetical protein
MQKKKINTEILQKQVTALEALKAALEEANNEAEGDMDLEEIRMMLESKQTDLNLTSLGNVKPIYLNNEDVRGGYKLAQGNIEIAAEELAAYTKSLWLNEGEKNKLNFQLGMVQSALQQTIKIIQLLITDGKVKMDDRDRFDMLTGIEEHVELVGEFLLAKIHETDVLIETRQRQKAREGKLKSA